VRGLLVAGNLAVAGVGIEVLREAIVLDVGARYTTARISLVLAYLLITAAVSTLVTNLGSDALNRGVRRAFRLFSLAYVALAVSYAFIALDYRRLHHTPATLQWTNAVGGLGTLFQAVGYWLWSTADRRALSTTET
jgi:phosphoglycerol transferase MdoB-like AlkP superfamily enzyme